MACTPLRFASQPMIAILLFELPNSERRTHIVFAWRQKYEAFWFSYAKHKRLHLVLGASVDHRKKINTEHSSKFPKTFISEITDNRSSRWTHAVLVTNSDFSRISRTNAVLSDIYCSS